MFWLRFHYFFLFYWKHSGKNKKYHWWRVEDQDIFVAGWMKTFENIEMRPMAVWFILAIFEIVIFEGKHVF